MRLRLRNKPDPFTPALLSLFLTAVTVLATVPSASQAASCPQAHRKTQSALTSLLPLLPMDPTYVGEEKGRYFDPEMQKYWNVKYFSEKEKEEFELFIKDGDFINRAGQKVESEFDMEDHHYKLGLFIIDSDFRIFMMPFDERGLYHHSSMSGGKPVIYAGTLALVNGKLREISDNSGHYKPAPLHTLNAIRTLLLMGADLRFLKLSGRITLKLLNTHAMTEKEVQTALRRLFENPRMKIQEIQSLISTEN